MRFVVDRTYDGGAALGSGHDASAPLPSGATFVRATVLHLHVSLVMNLDTPSRLQRLHTLLRDGHALTLAEAANHLDLSSKRHVRRLFRSLEEENGVPIQSSRRGLEKEFFLPPEELRVDDESVPLTERQTLALVVSIEAARSHLRPTPLHKPLDDAYRVLLERLESAARTYDLDRLRKQWYFDTAPLTEDIDPDVFDAVVRGMNEERSIRIDYYTAYSDTFREGRKLDPLHVAVTRGTWMCVAYCHFRDGIRDFALQRMSNAALCDPDTEPAFFDRPDDFDPDIYFREHFGGLTGEVHVVRLLVDADAAAYFQDRTFHPTQHVGEPRDDGRIEVSFEMPGLESITSFLLSWGSSVTVLEPPELVDRIQSEVRQLADRYGS